jgi:hypothetical protein
VFTVTNASLNFTDNNSDTGSSEDTLKLGNITTAITPAFTDIGHTSVSVDASAPTTLTDQGTGIFELGAADASVIDAHTTSELVMFLPDTNTTNGVTVTGSATDSGGANLLMGSSGEIVLDHNGNGFVGDVGSDTITGGAGADNIFGLGGNDVINLNSTDSTVWIGMYKSGSSTTTGIFVQAITDIVGGSETFVNGFGTGGDVTTVHGFTLGPTGDILNFNPSSWAVGALSTGFDFGLQNNAGSGTVPHGVNATLQLITAPGSTPNGSDVTLDGIAVYSNATALTNALHQATVGDTFLTGTHVIIAHAVINQLFAYNTPTGVNIADVTTVNNVGTTQSSDSANTNLTVTAHDLVDLVGTTSLGTVASHNIHFV